VSGACSTHGRGEKSVQDFVKAPRKETTSKTDAMGGCYQNGSWGDGPGGGGLVSVDSG
jgi:hypothetical protein